MPGVCGNDLLPLVQKRAHLLLRGLFHKAAVVGKSARLASGKARRSSLRELVGGYEHPFNGLFVGPHLRCMTLCLERYPNFCTAGPLRSHAWLEAVRGSANKR